MAAVIEDWEIVSDGTATPPNEHWTDLQADETCPEPQIAPQELAQKLHVAALHSPQLSLETSSGDKIPSDEEEDCALYVRSLVVSVTV